MRSLTAALLIGLAVAQPATAAAAAPPLFASEWDWDWDGFKKFWRRQLGKSTGIVGSVAIVVGVGVLIIMSAKKKT